MPGSASQRAPDPLGRELGAVGDHDLAGVERQPHADAAAVVERDPRRARRGVDERVEDRPVGDRVRAVAHRLGLALGRGDRAGVEVVAADHDRRRHLARGDQLVEAQPGAGGARRSRASRSAPAGPGSATRSLGQLDPAPDVRLVAEQVEDRARRSWRCRPGRRRARPSGTAPCPRRTAAGCRRGRSRGRRRRRRRRAPRPRRAARCRSRTPRRRAAPSARIAPTCASTDCADALR